MRQLYNLLADIGNSDIKTALAIRGSHEIKSVKRHPYSKETYQKDFLSALKQISKNIKNDKSLKIGISLLNNKFKKHTTDLCFEEFGIKPVFIDRNTELPIEIKYGEGIGIDRICNAVAAKVIYKKKNILVIDFGTATTYTMVSGNTLTGGLIAPGIKTSMISLTEKTSLPEIELTLPGKLINDNTKDNIKSGVLFQSYYSVIGIIKELKKEYGSLYTVTTGGLSELFKFEKSVINRTDRYLTLKGISIILSA